MNDEQYLEHCRSLLGEFAETLARRTKQLPQEHPLRELAAGFQALGDYPSDFYGQGPDLIARLLMETVASPSSSGLGHCPFTAVTGVRTP